MSSPRLSLCASLLGPSLFVLGGCVRDEPAGAPLDASAPLDVSAHAHDVPGEPLDASAPAQDVPIDSAADGSAPRDRSRDLEVRLDGWQTHLGHRAEFRVVGGDGSLVSLAVLRAVSTGRERFTLAAAMDARPARLDWFVDADDDPRYGAGDTSSTAVVPASPPFALSLTPVGSSSTPAALPGDRVGLTGHLGGFAVHVGVRFELSVTEVGSDRTVALYRDEAMSGVDSFDLRLSGALRPGVAYRVFLFIDLNDNGVYDPRGDHGSSVEGTATTRGLVFGHDHHTNRTWLE